MAKRNPKHCEALAEAIWPRAPFEAACSAYPLIDASPVLLLLMARLNDDPANDDGVVSDFCASFHLEKKAVMAAIRAYRAALNPVIH